MLTTTGRRLLGTAMACVLLIGMAARAEAGAILSIAGRSQVSVPEPAVVLLFGLGLLAFARLRFRRTKTPTR